jgi:integrase
VGTIIERKRAKGVRYTAQIRIKRDGRVVHSEAETFNKRDAARSWIEKREKVLARPGALEDAIRSPKGDTRTLGDAIDKYIETSVKAIGKTKAQVLRGIKNYDIADMSCGAIGSEAIVAFANELLKEVLPNGRTRTPQTVGNWISHLSAVFAIARPAWKFPLDYQAMQDAQAVMKRLGMISKSKERDRRPTLGELDLLMDHFTRRSIRRPTSSPMARIIAYAIYSTRRQDEICRQTWADLDAEGLRIWVRDMKNPGDKVGNDILCELTPEALRIIEVMPKISDRIFPYTADAISAAFTRACQLLDIEDLHFHDLRHEGISRLFEMGRTPPQAASVSGHRGWSSLQRYTHLRQTGDRFADWKWLPMVTEPIECSSFEPLSQV